MQAESPSSRPLVVRCGAFGDMVLLTALIRVLHARFDRPVDILTSGPWSEPLLLGQPGVGEVICLRSRKTPYWLAPDQRRAVRRLRARGPRPTWICDSNDAVRPLLTRAGIGEEYIVDVRDHPLQPGEHATQQWVRLGLIMPSAISATRDSQLAPQAAAPAAGCYLQVSAQQRAQLEGWLETRGLDSHPLILIQSGNKRTMRRGLRRLAANNKYWPNERWASVIRHLRAHWPDHRIVMLGTGPEYRLNREIAGCAAVDGVYNVADDLPIPRLVALLERAAGLITVDSGPAHAAAAVGCPEVVLFGKALPSLYRPWGTAGADVKVLTGRCGGEPSMLGITAEEVIDAWSALRQRGTPDRP